MWDHSSGHEQAYSGGNVLPKQTEPPSILNKMPIYACTPYNRRCRFAAVPGDCLQNIGGNVT